MPAIQKQLQMLPQLAKQGIPSFLTGDFNAPSHLDYTAAAVGTRKEVKYAVDWPVSQAMADAGFRDSYREAHPDPVKDPGFTWWAARPKVAAWASNPTAKDPQDRIDFVYAAGPSKTRVQRDRRRGGGPRREHQCVTVAVGSSRRAVDLRGHAGADAGAGGRPNKRLVTVGEPLTVTYHSPTAGRVGRRS